MVLQDVWIFSTGSSWRGNSITRLQLPSGWEYKASWINYSEAKPTQQAQHYKWGLGDQRRAGDSQGS